MSNSINNERDERHDRDERRANPMGAYLATVGAVVLLISVWLDWVGLGPGDSDQNPSSGYEADSVIPLLGCLAVGFALALLYATKRADRRQHRGLSLASFAVGLAALLWSILFIADPISTVQYDQNVSVKWGAYIGALGALLWTLGSILLAKEPEGDFEDQHLTVAGTTTTAHPVAHRTPETNVHEHDLGQSGTTFPGTQSNPEVTEGGAPRRPGTTL